MRIAFTLGGTDDGRSGLGSYVKAVLPELSSLARRSGDELLALGSPEELAAYDGVLANVETHAIPRLATHPGASALWYLMASGMAARSAAADVVLYPAANRRAGAVNPLPSVAVVHDLGQLHVPEKYDVVRMAYVRHALLRVLRRATRLVAISRATQRDLVAALGVEHEQIDVVLNGVDVDRFVPIARRDARVEQACQQLGIRGPYLLYPARLEHPAKNHLRLIEAFSKSGLEKTHELVLMGGDWGARERILATAGMLGVIDRVNVTGFVDDALVPLVTAGADAVVLLGLREGFGLPALEALATGRAVCASNTGALPEIVGDLAALCDPYSVDSIASALRRVVLDQELRRRCEAEGPAHARAFGWGRTAEGLHRACRHAARARLRPGRAHMRSGRDSNGETRR
jgi:glycosyltransferase involved in cell wall biosynthesis